MNELVEILQTYLDGSQSLRNCAAWLAGVDWDDLALTQEERERLGLFDLLSTEIAEGMREEKEFREAAARVVAHYKLAEEFRTLADQWCDETGLFSFERQWAAHPAYQRILEMGEKVVPFILRELQDRPAHWFGALHTITGENPVPPESAGNFQAMTKAWLQWGRESGHIS